MFKKQPKIDVKPTALDRTIIKAGWLVVILNFIVVFAFYFQLPETVPIHFNMQGEPNGFESKETLFVIPMLSGVLYLGMTLMVTKMKPWNFNYPTKVTEKNAQKLYPIGIRMLVISNLSSVIILLAVTVMVLWVANGRSEKIDITLLLGLIITLAIVPFLYIFKMFSVAKE